MLALALEAEPPGPLEDGEEGKDREQTPGAGAQRRKERPPRDARQTATIKRGVFSEKPLKFCAEALARVRGTRWTARTPAACQG